MRGIDAMHGNSNVYGATLFPHNIGLGAAHNKKLIAQMGAAVGKAVRAMMQAGRLSRMLADLSPCPPIWAWRAPSP